MQMRFQKLLLVVCLLSFLINSCSKAPATNSDPCVGKTISITATVAQTSGGTASNGSITAVATGSSNFTYSINSGPFQSNGTFTNLAPGNYTVVAKDADGCTGSQQFAVTAAACPTIVVTLTATNTTTSTSTDGTITASATGSTGFTFSINGGTFQAAGNFSALAAGSYTITAKDANGCTGTATVAVLNPSCPTISVTATATATSGPTATNGSINASASGGVSPYTFSRNGGAFQATGSFANLSAGNYTILARDANGCLSAAFNIAVTSAPCPSITVSVSTTGSDKCTNNNGTIVINASGSTGYTYKLNTGAFQPSNTFSALATGNYNITVADVNGCSITQAASVPIAAAGANFTSVKAVLLTNCALSGCHSGPSPQSGLDFTIDCTITAQALRIKARAVDANPSVMPPTGAISAADRQKIINWVNAGGQHSN